jgi:CheY-like chemotaxis protein
MMAERQEFDGPPPEQLRVLLVDNDQDIRDLVEAVLTDEGYAVTVLGSTDHEAVTAEVGRLEPDCILLDGAEGPAFGDSWSAAAYLRTRARAVPTVMFTAHSKAVKEARERRSKRAVDAGFAAVVPKPFLLDELLAAVESASGRSDRFDRSEDGDRGRTAELVDELRAAGATDIRTSERREWATFISPHDDRIYQLYWWQLRGVYMVGRYDADARLEMVGRYFEREAAIAAALASPTPAH